MTGFVKLFSTILDSSIWSEELHVRIVWITMLAMADRNGRVDAAVSGVARRACVTRDQCVDAIERLEAPDFDSRTPDNDGRRVTKIDGGWQILNYAKYRKLGADAAERERKREWWSEHRSESASTASGREDALAAASALPLLLVSSEQGESEGEKGPAVLPKTWEPAEDTIATLEAGMVDRWAIPELVRRFRAHFCPRKSVHKAAEEWESAFARWAHSDWNDPKKRPVKPGSGSAADDPLGGRTFE